MTGARIGERWPLALAAALLRGGLVALALPILVLPSTVEVATFVGPASITPTGPTPALLRLALAVGAGVVAWLLVGGLLAALAEVALIRIETEPTAATDPDDPPLAPFLQARPAGEERVVAPRPARRGPVRLAVAIVVARGLAALPVLLALVWAVPRLGSAAYAELTAPSETTRSGRARVVAAAPDALVVVMLAWLVAAAVGAVAARRIVLRDAGPLGAATAGVRAVAGRPLRSLGPALGPLLAALPLVGLPLALARVAWAATTIALPERAGPVATLAPVVLLVAAWSAALAGLAALAAAGSRAWTATVVATTPGGAAADPPSQASEAAGSPATLGPRPADGGRIPGGRDHR